MNREELRSIQGPIKESYRENPELAMITLRSEGEVGGNLSCSIDTGKILMEAGLHKATGGTGMLACSGDLLLEALVACAGVTLKAVSTSIGIDVRKGKISAEGDLDFRGTLAVSKEVPVGFKAIRLNFDLECEAEKSELDNLIKLTKRYCVVYQTLLNATAVEMSVKN